MKRILIAALGLALAFAGMAYAGDTYVRGYTKKDGTYVQGHYRTKPNSTANDNYSTRGNVNPYTGESGTKPRDEDAGWGYTPYTTDKPKKSNPYSWDDGLGDDDE